LFIGRCGLLPPLVIYLAGSFLTGKSICQATVVPIGTRITIVRELAIMSRPVPAHSCRRKRLLFLVVSHSARGFHSPGPCAHLAQRPCAVHPFTVAASPKKQGLAASRCRLSVTGAAPLRAKYGPLCHLAVPVLAKNRTRCVAL